MRRCAFLLLLLFFQNADAQKGDSISVHNIDGMIELIERLVSHTAKEIKDTVIYSIEEGSGLPDTQHVHTTYFISSGSVIKVIKHTKHKYWTHSEIMYVQNEKPIKYNRQSYYLDLLKDDFDIYFKDDTAVYKIERVGVGKPYPPAFLAFCYEILRSR